MNPEVVVGAFLMTLAFLSLGIGSVSLERFRIVGTMVLIFMSTGVLFNAGAILLLFLKARTELYSIYGLSGFVSFLVVLVNTGWVWSVYARHGYDGKVSPRLVKYTKIAYAVWGVSYLSGMVFLIWI